MELQFLGEEIVWKDYCHIFAGKAIKGDSFDSENIIGLRVSNNKEERGVLRFREVRNKDFLVFRPI